MTLNLTSRAGQSGAIAVLLVLTVSWAGVCTADPVPIGIGGLPGAANEEDAKTAKDFGLNFLHETTRWDEPRQGDYKWKDFTEEDDPFAARISKLKDDGYTVAVTFKNVDDDKKRLPLYLAGRPFDDPDLLKRWTVFLKAFVRRYGQEIDFLNLGHQVNNYFGKHETEWPAYVRFVAAGSIAIRKEAPKISVGVVLNHTDDPPRFWRDLAPACTHFAMTYTTPCSIMRKDPTLNALTPKHPKFFANTFETVMRMAGRRKLLLTEVSCPTHLSIDSSPAIQARFIQALFAWLRRAESRVAGLSWAGDKDWPYEATQGALRQMFGDQVLELRGFIRLLTSRGLRYEDGRKKPGYEAFKKALETYRKGR